MITVADILQEARYYIQDVRVPLRHDDEELEMYLRSALGFLYQKRPDVFASVGCEPADLSWDHTSEELDISSQWKGGLAYYVAASAELKDDEHAGADKKSAYLFSLAYSRMGIAA